MENNVLTWKLSTEKEGRLGRKLRTVQVSLRPVESMTELEKFRVMSLWLPPVRSHWEHVVGWSPWEAAWLVGKAEGKVEQMFQKFNQNLGCKPGFEQQCRRKNQCDNYYKHHCLKGFQSDLITSCGTSIDTNSCKNDNKFDFIKSANVLNSMLPVPWSAPASLGLPLEAPAALYRIKNVKTPSITRVMWLARCYNISWLIVFNKILTAWSYSMLLRLCQELISWSCFRDRSCPSSFLFL